ncbi:thioredoxin family protein [Streptococcus vestibularis]|uniref:thioredoxin family protein n=1 Tax=Streptococcus vestibularis TaxID=1343 RepID=UPI0026DEF3F2|nr:thioredoxin family protein [Streptococcus vestibularis]
MKKGLELLSLFVMTLLCLCGLSVMIYGGYQLYQEVIPQYSQELTEGSYRDAVVSQNVNLVFYRKNCPYCQAGKSAVIEAAKNVQHTTFYINVETKDGQELVKRYDVFKAATMVVIREGKAKSYRYAKKTKDGRYVADLKQIEEALND